MNKKLPALIILSSLILLGCTYIVRSEWHSDLSSDQGTVRLHLGQEKWNPPGSIYPFGSLSVQLNSPRKISDVQLLTSDVKLIFIKKNAIIKEQKISLETFEVYDDNSVGGIIKKHHKYTSSSGPDSLDWDEFIRLEKKSDNIECDIFLKFKADGIIYIIKQKGILKKDIKREISRGIE